VSITWDDLKLMRGRAEAWIKPAACDARNSITRDNALGEEHMALDVLDLVREVRALAELRSDLFRAANIFKAICEAGQDDPSAAIQALEAMPFVRDLIRDRACECPMGEIDKHDPGCRLRAP
jgi:hypothetical protein